MSKRFVPWLLGGALLTALAVVPGQLSGRAVGGGCGEAPQEATNESAATALFSADDYRGDFTPIAPAASGAVTVTATYGPRDRIIFAGTELNGAFRSTDRGDSWTNVSLGLQSRQILSLAVTKRGGRHYLFAGTTDGVYRSRAMHAQDVGDTWSFMDRGFESACDKQEGCGTNRPHPVQVVTVDPNPASQRVWAGIGGVMAGNDVAYYRTNDVWKLYRSDDLGETWQGVLAIEPNPAALGTVSPAVFQIVVDPDDSDHVWIASDAGLYVTHDAGRNWYELGRERLRRGRTNLNTKTTVWGECGVDTTCSSQYGGGGRCASATEDSQGELTGCLPIATTAGETSPNVRGVRVVRGVTYALIYDTGVGSDELEQCPSGRDRDFEHYRGGVWRSENLRQWTYLKPPSNRVFIRCDEDDDVTTNTLFTFFDVDPSDPDHIVMVASYPRGSATGFYELKDGTWTWQRDVCKVDSGGLQGATVDCYEGGQMSGIWSRYAQTAPGAYGFHVSAWEPLTAYVGHIMGYWRIKHAPSGAQWQPSDGYTFEHLAQESGGNPTSRQWRSTGIDLHCPHAGVGFLGSPAEPAMFVGAIDVGVLKAHGSTPYWTKVTEENQTLEAAAAAKGVAMSGNNPLRLDNNRVLVADNDESDPTRSVLYANSDHNDGADGEGNKNFMLRARYPGDEADWENIGGLFYDGDCAEVDADAATEAGRCAGNGLRRTYVVMSAALEPDPSGRRGAGERRLWVGTNGDGIYVFDPVASEPQWQHLSGAGCDVFSEDSARRIKVESIINLADHGHPELFVATALDTEANAYGWVDAHTTTEGVYLIEASTGTEPSYSCTRLEGPAGDGACAAVSTCDLGGPVGAIAGDGANRTCECSPRAPVRVQAVESAGGGVRLLSVGRFKSARVVYGADMDPSVLAGNASEVRWQIVFGFDPATTFAGLQWSRYLDDLDPASQVAWRPEYEEWGFLERRRISSLNRVPSFPRMVLLTMENPPTVPRHAVGHVYKSLDGGYSFKVAREYEGLPYKALRRVDFSPDGSEMYLAGACSSLYRGPSPYADRDGDGLSLLIDPDDTRANQWYVVNPSGVGPALAIHTGDRFVTGTSDGRRVSVEGISDAAQSSGERHGPEPGVLVRAAP